MKMRKGAALLAPIVGLAAMWSIAVITGSMVERPKIENSAFHSLGAKPQRAEPVNRSLWNVDDQTAEALSALPCVVSAAVLVRGEDACVAVMPDGPQSRLSERDKELIRQEIKRMRPELTRIWLSADWRTNRQVMNYVNDVHAGMWPNRSALDFLKLKLMEGDAL